MGRVVNKSYNQYCGVAAALDRIGDRWTLLVLRELSFGERRFTDLRAALPGVATNLLSERLRGLEADGLVEQHELPAPASRTVYALTEQGKRVRPVLRALSAFGLPHLDDPVEGEVRPQMAVHGTLCAALDPRASLGVDLSVIFDLDGTELRLQVRDGELVRPDTSAAADLTVRGSAAALVEVCRGTSGLAAAAPRLELEGTRAARRTFARAFGLAS